VVKVLNNGNYFISGRRELLINGEKQIMQISGVIRPIDIDPDNMILSTQIADAKILYKTEAKQYDKFYIELDEDKVTLHPVGITKEI
jgi:flagellar L-ring protein precursor FlgH